MMLAHLPKSNGRTDATASAAEHGITRVLVEYFYVGGFKYTNLDDAIEQAKRVKVTPPDHKPQPGDVMSSHGITRVEAEHFHLGDYRYTNLNDAVAQARRRPTDVTRE